MFSFEGCHPEYIPLPSLLILQINVYSAEETVSFKVKGLFSLAVQRTAATYWTFLLLFLSSVNVYWVAAFAAACLVYLLTWNSLYEVIAPCACSVNPLTSLLTKSYDIVYINKRFWANRASYRIYSINLPGRLLSFWTLRVGAYSRWALIRGWALIKFSPFLASEVCLFCNKTINANNKTRRSNKARFL